MSYPAQDVILKYNNTGINRYPITFEYDDELQVVVRAWNELTNEYSGVLNKGTDYVFDGPTNIVFLIAVPDKFTIFRSTDISQSYGSKRYSKFSQGNAIRASDLNGNFELLRQAIQETQSGEGDNSGDISELQTKLDQEIIDRTDGDANLQSQINQEVTDRTQGDQNLQNQINTLNTGKVNSVTATAPVVATTGLDPVISMPAASSSQDGYMSKEDKIKLDAALDNGDGYIELTDYPELKTIIPLDADAGLQLPDQTSASGYEVEGAVRYNTNTDRIEVYDTAWSGVAGGAEISTSPPTVAAPGDLWWDSEEGRGYVYYDDGDSKQWVESNPSWNGSIPDGSVTPPKLSAGGPSWDTSGNLDVSGRATFTDGIDVVGRSTFQGDKIVIATDGTFQVSTDNANKALMLTSGYFVSHRSSPSATLYEGINNGSQTFRVGANGSAQFAANRIKFAADGSAEFAGQVTIDGSGSDNCILISQNGAGKTRLRADGSASFASDVGFGTGLQSNGYGGYLGIGNTTNGKYGGVIVVMDTDDGNAQPCFRAKKLSSTPVEIRWDGSADFNGIISVGENNSVRIFGDGGVVCNRTDSGANNTFNAQLNGSTNAFIRADGNASFKSTRSTSLLIETEPDNDDSYTTTTEEYTETESYTGPLGNTLEREVTKTRDVRTYTGPTLDVKERLLNLISRLDALEADEIIDDSNSSALLQLVHNLSSRLDLRDQQIADLTNRIQTLELNS